MHTLKTDYYFGIIGISYKAQLHATRPEAMTDELSPVGLFCDLSTNPEIKSAILLDCELAVDDFAAKHSKTIREHYAVGGYNLDFEDTYQSAVRLWRYLRGI